MIQQEILLISRYNPTKFLVDGIREAWEWFLTHQLEYFK